MIIAGRDRENVCPVKDTARTVWRYIIISLISGRSNAESIIQLFISKRDTNEYSIPRSLNNFTVDLFRLELVD